MREVGELETRGLRVLLVVRDTVRQSSPAVGYVACCRHPRNFFVCPIKAETEPEDCSLEVVAATTPSEQPST